MERSGACFSTRAESSFVDAFAKESASVETKVSLRIFDFIISVLKKHPHKLHDIFYKSPSFLQGEVWQLKHIKVIVIFKFHILTSVTLTLDLTFMRFACVCAVYICIPNMKFLFVVIQKL